MGHRVPRRRQLNVSATVLCIVASVPFVVTTMSGNAFALVLCSSVNRATGQPREGGPLRLRTNCKSTEVQIDPATVGLQGPPGAQGPAGVAGPQGSTGPSGAAGDNGTDGLSCWDRNQSHSCDVDEDISPPIGCGIEDCVPSGPGRLVVVDEGGTEVGSVVGDGDLNQPLPVTRTIDGHEAEFFATQFSLSGTGGAAPTHMYFSTTDCTGVAYMQVDDLGPQSGFFPNTVSTPTRLYFPTGPHELQARQSWRERSLPNGEYAPCGGSFGGGYTDMFPISEYRLDQFTPPFALITR